MLHNYVVAHKASSLGRSGLSCQASQLVGAFIFFPTIPPTWRCSDPKYRPMTCVPQDSRRHAFICPPEGLHTPSTSRESLQLNQSSPSFTFAAHLSLRNSTRQTGAAVLAALDNFYRDSGERRAFQLSGIRVEVIATYRRDSRRDGTFNFLRRCVSCIPRVPKGNPGACRTATTFAAILSFSYTVDVMARRKRAGLFPAYAYPARRATVHIPLADRFSKCRCASGPHMRAAV